MGRRPRVGPESGRLKLAINQSDRSGPAPFRLSTNENFLHFDSVALKLRAILGRARRGDSSFYSGRSFPHL